MSPETSQKSPPLRVLHIEDNSDVVLLVERLLKMANSATDQISGFEVRSAQTLEEGRKILSEGNTDIVLLDLSLPDASGLGIFKQLHERFPHMPIVVLTGNEDQEVALEAVRGGAQDFLPKSDLSETALSRVLTYAVSRQRMWERAERYAKELEASEMRYRTVFEYSAAAITVTDSEERIVSWNKAAEELLGLNKGEMQHRKVSSLYPEDEWKRIRSFNLRQKGASHHFETTMLRKDGTPVDVDISVSVLKDAEGKVTGSIGIVRDITRRKEAERKIRLAEEKYRTVFEYSAAAITVTDDKERIVSWNKFAEDLLGMSREDLYSKHVSCLYTENEWKRIRSYDLRSKGAHHHIEAKMLRKDGEEVDVEVAISVLKDADGKITGSIGISRDISERKRFERMKDEFVSMVTHELRTPMFVIREGISQLNDGVLGEVSEKQKKFLAMSLKNIDRLANIVDDLLDISKIEADRMDLDKQNFNLVELMDEIQLNFKTRAQKKKLELRKSHSAERIEINADRDRLTQVFTNLVGNALKFTKEGFVEISAEDKPDHIECRISDSGPGIPKDNISQIFNKFRTFGRPSSSSEKGTGLGLSICRGIVELHEGKIWAESEPGKGTSFVFTLPRKSTNGNTGGNGSADT